MISLRRILLLIFFCIPLLLSPSFLSAQDPVPDAGSQADVVTPVPLVEAEDESGFVASLNDALTSTLGKATSVMEGVLFFPVYKSELKDPKGNAVTLPLIVLCLIFGAVFFTVWFGFINIRAFWHSIDVIRGKYDSPNDTGEVSHFQALTSALSATVGLGNIAGVAIAIQVGGPGAVLWMTLGGLFGMSSKFTECTLGQMYRKTNIDGTISGGGMYYLERGLKEIGPRMGIFGKVLAVIFAISVVVATMGAGNMFQGNQSYAAFQSTFEVEDSAVSAGVFGAIMAILVGVVILGGIKRIGAATSRIVPFMAALYVLVSLFIVITHFADLPGAISAIFKGAFTPEAGFGGVIGVAVQGIRRSTFSNEAGIGSAPMAHSAAKTEEPVREGIVALLEPFIDTVVICNMTALVIILTGVYTDPTVPNGVAMTKLAFAEKIEWFPYVLAACVILFAYSTMISWGYYGERAWIYLFDHFGEGIGLRSLVIFRVAFVFFVYIGVVVSLDAIIAFSDVMFFVMAVPNIIGCIILAPMLKRKVDDYWRRYKSGEMKSYK